MDSYKHKRTAKYIFNGNTPIEDIVNYGEQIRERPADEISINFNPVSNEVVLTKSTIDNILLFPKPLL